MKKICGLLFFSLFFQILLSQSIVPLEFISLSNGDSVVQRPTVLGITNVVSIKEVWIVVHPLDVAKFWVQPMASVKKDSTWKVMIFVGEPGKKDIYKSFEIKAFSNPRKELSDGQVLTGWPKSEFESDLIEVIRK